jgi:hypothetical protein
MELTSNDLELMDLLTLQVPWYMVCGEFHEIYGGPEPLARRLVELSRAELLVIRDTSDAHALVTSEVLANDALANNCYENIEKTREPRWDMMATDAGFALIEERLGRQ